MSKSRKENLGYWEVTAIGVGGMVGGGIFAVLGLAVELTGGGAPVAFLIAGLVALVTSYSYVRLSVTYLSQGGTAAFLGSGIRLRPVDGEREHLALDQLHHHAIPLCLCVSEAMEHHSSHQIYSFWGNISLSPEVLSALPG